MEKTKKLLREFVKEVLKEDDTGGTGYGGGGGDSSGQMGGWGYGMMNYGPSIRSWAIDPFLDLGKIFKASAMKIGTRVKTLGKIIVETVLTTVVPVLETNYKLIFEHEKNDLNKIRDKYRDAFSRVDGAFTEDVMMLSFMLNPSSFVVGKVAANSPKQILSALEIFSHGNDNIKQYLDNVSKRLEQIHNDLTQDIDQYKIDQKGKFVPKGQRGPYLTQKKRDQFQKAGIMDSVNYSDHAIFESQKQETETSYIQKVLEDPNLKKLIESSPLAQQMQKDARNVANDLGNKILQEVRRVFAAKTIEDLQQIVKKPLGSEKLNTLSPQEKQQAEQILITQVKSAMKQFYIKSLEGEINNSLQRGISPNNLYIATLKNMINKIDQLK